MRGKGLLKLLVLELVARFNSIKEKQAGSDLFPYTD